MPGVRKKQKFTQIEQPFVCILISDSNPTDLIQTIWLSDYDGSDAYQIFLTEIEKKFLNERDLKPVFRSTIKPIMVSHYRWVYEGHVDMDEEERVRVLVDAVRWGADGIDMEADTFDPCPGPPEWSDEAGKYSLNPASKPREFTMNPDAIERQKAVIEEVQGLGGEVILSAHARVRLTVEECVSMAKEMEARGADIVKVVKVDTSFEDMLDTMRAILEIKKVLKVPFIMGSHGQHAKIARAVGPLMGSMLAWCVQPLSRGRHLGVQPPIRIQKEFWENIDWKVFKSPEEEGWL